MKRLSGYPSWFYHLLVATTLVATISGLLMIPTLLEFKLQWDMMWRLPSSQWTPIVAIHVGMGLLMLMLLGALWNVHMRAGWRKRLNRASGISMGLFLCILGASGLGLYYFGSETSQLFTSLLHLFVGLAFPLFLLWHIMHSIRLRQLTTRADAG